MEENRTEKRLKGYKIMLVVLIVLVAVLTSFFVMQIGTLRENHDYMTAQRDTLANRLSVMMTDFDGLQTENDTINANLEIERLKADSLMDRLKQERNWSASKIRDYEKQMNSLKLIMQGYVRQVDSLNRLAEHLQRENVEYRRQASTLQLRAETAEERAQELDTKVRRGAIILARDIRLLALNNNDREVTRASRASRLRTDFVLTANELAQPGVRDVFVRITGPDGYVMANPSNATFEADGERLTYSASRQVDYDNADLPVNVFYNGGRITAGSYKLEIFLDGQRIGSNEIILR